MTKPAKNPGRYALVAAGGQILANLMQAMLALGREKRAHGLSGFGLEIAAYIAAPEQLAEWLRAHD